MSLGRWNPWELYGWFRDRFFGQEPEEPEEEPKRFHGWFNSVTVSPPYRFMRDFSWGGKKHDPRTVRIEMTLTVDADDEVVELLDKLKDRCPTIVSFTIEKWRPDLFGEEAA